MSLVAERLEAHPPQDGADELVLAAFQGADVLGAALGGEAAPVATPQDARARAAPAAVYLTAIEVEGFRGIGEPSTLSIDPGPGLTLVVGRNGSGKSSFSEALEMLLTGTNQRWKGRTRVWQDGWQNLHHRHTRVSARFTADGRRQPLAVSREWPDAAGVEASTLRIDGKAQRSLDVLGWTRPLADHPPLLSHNELEHSLDEKQTTLYDALAGILGLGELAAAQEVLRRARLDLERAARDAKTASSLLIGLLEQTDDERAGIVLAALQRKPWDLGAVQRTVAGRAAVDEHSTLQRLRDLSALQLLDREELHAAVKELRDAAAALERARGTDASRADETAILLQQALEVHSHTESTDCPVCGSANVLTYDWRRRTVERVKELREAAIAVAQTARLGADARARARRLVAAMPPALRDAAGVGVDVDEATQCWTRWTDVPDGESPLDLAAHLESAGPPLIAAVAAVRAAARTEAERRERSWRPAADAILQWLPLGIRTRDSEVTLRRVSIAERWLRDAHDSLRDERFRPIAGAVQANWTQLRQDSNVTLGALELTGTGPQRRLVLDVSVDGEPGSALGVMSQGELNCLALSLFLPRASLPESPFRFVVIDDPVQAMDPAKVEGLARVLARAAEQRQVIVLTHDDRLTDAVRFLDLEATVIEVTRRDNSVVELRRVLDPVRRYIDDAFAVAKSDGLPPEAVRVVPGFCRLALEAACARAVTRRMLLQGRRYADVRPVLERPTTLMMWLAAALLGDPERGGDVVMYLQRQQPWAVEAVKECNRGAHSGQLTGHLTGFIRTIEKLAGVIAPADGAHG